MVIITDRIGQLCNRLFHFSYFIANSIEYDYKVIYPYFDDYQHLFECTRANHFLNLSVSTKITPFNLLNRGLLKALNTIHLPGVHVIDVRANHFSEIYDLNNECYQNLVHNGIVLTKGWVFKDEANLKKHKSVIREIFTPVEPYLSNSQKIISQLRLQFDCIAGIHIRRGDYLTWHNGVYYFSDEVYAAKMAEFETEINLVGKTCCFLICSNEEVNKTAFANFNIDVEQRHFITDLYTLALCDYIIGPPSTFSFWASFYGDVPLVQLENPATDVSLQKFITPYL